MADNADEAQTLVELQLSISLKNRKVGLRNIGKCHWCQESISDNAHFCDTDCRDDYQQDKRRRG
ncbi:hypothetical protein [Rheinheimera sp. MMS21-TC3]|uniref:hypothetical protein n=1 Tax=Rheinheimera sp. MMS21-TC3 TaxID=3072790 RepID=UPI0028C4FFF6|nr:hypothetical protein [Rheinheimera sp. MMS21-TC3]WNO60421.1 hypothetical protein RDV63_05505 [Rheinheimera sp. MMS21-TC3]